MKKLILLMAFALPIVMTVESCKSGEKSTNEVTEETIAGSSELILSFFSPGNGIDREMLDKVTSFLKTEYPNVVYTRVKWGREGEIDLCFDLASVGKDAKAELISKLKSMVAESSKVRVKENATCREQR